MDLSKLSQNEKLALYGSIALVVGGLLGYSYGVTVLGVLAGLAMLVVLFLPQLSPGTTLPGSRGSILLLMGGIAGVVMLLALWSAVTGVLFVETDLRDLFFLIAVAGAFVMAWAGWQEFQAEGGKFQLGSTDGGTSSTAAAAPGGAAVAAEPPAGEAPPAAEPEDRYADDADATAAGDGHPDERDRPIG